MQTWKQNSNIITHLTFIRISSQDWKHPGCGLQNVLPDVPYFLSGQVSATKWPQLHWRQDSCINYTAIIISYYSLYNAQHYSVSELVRAKREVTRSCIEGWEGFTFNKTVEATENTLFSFHCFWGNGTNSFSSPGSMSYWVHSYRFLNHEQLKIFSWYIITPWYFCLFGKQPTYPLVNLHASFSLDLHFCRERPNGLARALERSHATKTWAVRIIVNNLRYNKSKLFHFLTHYC